MANIFEQVQRKSKKRNRFEMSHNFKFTCDFGDLIPVLCQETLPGDSFNIQTGLIAKTLAMLAPIMHDVNIDIHYFYVANRLIWKQFEDMIENAVEGHYTIPQIEITANPGTSTDVNGVPPLTKHQLADYFGLPIEHEFTKASGTTVNVLPFAAYKQIWYEYYRDENFINKDYTIDGEPQLDDEYYVIDGDNIILSAQQGTKFLGINKRAWQRDYYTAALPRTQSGFPAMVPVAGMGAGELDVKTRASENAATFVAIGTPSTPDIGGASFDGSTNSLRTASGKRVTPHNWYADASSGTGGLGFLVEDLRKSLALQEFMERDMRTGRRYIEKVFTEFGYMIPDYRIARPEFLGGSRQPLIVNEINQTSEDGSTPLGERAGLGMGAGKSKKIRYTTPEHGWIIGIMSILPRTEYFQGIEKKWLRKDALDLAWPAFQQLGEQKVEKREVLYRGDPTDFNTFGYVPRYAEYRHNNNRIAGDLRDTLKFWALTREFSGVNPINLNRDFIEFNYDKRIWAVTDPDFKPIVVNMLHKMSVKRNLTRYGNPKSFM